jgi:hypothetical protein
MFKAGVNKSGQATISRVIESFVAVSTQHGNVDPAVAARQGYDAAIASGRLEEYGRFAWENPKGTKSLPQVTGIKPDHMGAVMFATIDAKLKASGFKAGGNGEHYEITRNPDRNGKMDMYITAMREDDGTTKTIRLTSDDLIAYKSAGIQEELDRKRRRPTTVMVAPARAGGY